MTDVVANEPVEIAKKILVVRERRVMLDSALADLFGVSTKVLNQAVRRNRDRFPDDFLLEISDEEWEILRSQIVTLRSGRNRYRKYAPLAFTEHGAIMAATILNSPRAIQMSVYVVRAFVRLRQAIASHAHLARELDDLKRTVAKLDANTRRQFDQVYEAILELMPASARKS